MRRTAVAAFAVLLVVLPAPAAELTPAERGKKKLL